MLHNSVLFPTKCRLFHNLYLFLFKLYVFLNPCAKTQNHPDGGEGGHVNSSTPDMYSTTVCVSSFRLRAHLALLLSLCLLPFPVQEIQSIWQAVWRDDCVPRSIQAIRSQCMAFPAAYLVSCSFCLIACLYLMA